LVLVFGPKSIIGCLEFLGLVYGPNPNPRRERERERELAPRV